MKAVLKTLAGAVCALALASSVYGLWHVCIELALMPWLIAAGVVAVFDGSALVFGLKVATNPKATAAWVGVIFCAVLSAGAQILAAPEAANWWRLLHGAPAIGAIWALHNAVKGEQGNTKRRRAATTRQAVSKTKGPRDVEAAGAGLQATAPAGPPAIEPSRDASVVRLELVGREGDRRAMSLDAGPPNLTPEQMADLVRPRLGDAKPSQRRVWDLCKSIDPAWSQKNGRAVAAILNGQKEETGT